MQKLSTLLIVCTLAASMTSCSLAGRNTVSTAPKPKTNTIGFNKPVTTRYRVSQQFKPKSNPKHKGIDIAGKKGSPIFSVKSGRVIYQGQKFSGYGKMIMVKHANGITTLYSHLNKIFVKAGQIVTDGQLLGTMGRTGRATGVHLHFEIMQNMEPVDPQKYIKL